MSKDKRVIFPSLRFPRFRAAPLPVVSLSDVTSESTERNGDQLRVGAVMGVFKSEGIIPMEERLVSSDIARYKIVRKDWYAYNPMRLNIGSIARWSGNNNVLVSPDYVVFRCLNEQEPGIDPEFLDQFRRSLAWASFVGLNGNGSVRVRIYFDDLGKVLLGLPALEEQRKIAASLSSLDDLIAVEGQKFEALKTYKKGLMQQLFPRVGEAAPRLRFPDFRGSGEWKSGQLSDYALIVRGGSPRPIDEFITSSDDGLNWLKIGDINKDEKYVTRTQDRVLRSALAKTREVVPGDLILSNSMSFGRPYILAISACIHDGWIAVTRLKSSLDRDYLYYQIGTESSQSFFTSKAAGSGVQNLNADIIKALPLSVPEPAEQSRIASFLSSLDDRIAAHAQKIDALKAHKKGLMQGLFPAIPGDAN